VRVLDTRRIEPGVGFARRRLGLWLCIRGRSARVTRQSLRSV